MPRNESRAIHVEGRNYRWAVSPDSGYMNLVLQDGSGSGQRVLIQMDYEDVALEGHSLVQRRRVTPGFVRRCIREAAAFGWKPAESGTEILMRLQGERVVSIRPV